MQAREVSAERRAQVWQVVSMIPKGKVATYGQVAALIGLPSHSRFVGTTLRHLPKGSKLPWYRVLNAGLKSSLTGGAKARQHRLLRAEDVTFIGDKVAKAHHWDAGR
ncbi:MAG: MGMT family protein [Pseudomonadota bacterium]